MTVETASRTTPLTDEAIADLAVGAISAEADLTPKPGLVDRRGPGAHTDMNLAMLHVSAEALRAAFTACTQAARSVAIDVDLRTRIGAIGRAGETAMLTATGGVNTHRGALWALGLLCAGVAADRRDPAAVAAKLAALPDRDLIATPSHGAAAGRRYGVTGAKGEAKNGFPNVVRYALPALLAARAAGADEQTARLEALLALMAELDDTCILHRGGAGGLYAVQSSARAVLAAGGIRTAAGRRHFVELDRMCRDRRLSPGGSADLLSAALFLDGMRERTETPCRM
ncbi:triphosphoribosyl-dephospho-CoA synthase [Mycobacterium sp. BMJ-28]